MRSWIVIITIVLSGPAGNAQGKTIHVKAGATGDGGSWANAYGDLQDALDDAEPNDDIWVAEGTYTPTGLVDPCDPRSATFQMKDAVAIYGGFPATGEPGWDDRDHQGYVTILSGDLLGNDDPSTPVADLLDDPCRCENSYHVVTGTNTESAPNTLLDGFTVTAGNANDWPYQSGGGLYRYSGLVNECTITGNSARSGGGGMQSEAGHMTVTECAFARNSAHQGGGMSQDSSDKVTVSRCTFSNNVADAGGGIYNYSTLSLTDCTFAGNSAVEEGGGMFNDYGRLAADNCTFNNNSAEFGGGVYCYYSVGLTLTNCTFSGNSAEFGGGLCHKYSEISTVTDCIFSEHSGGELGGGIYNYAGRGTVTGCTFSDNSSWWGGGMYNQYFSGSVINCTFIGNSTVEEGGGMCNFKGGPTVIGCTFSGNSAQEAGGGMDNDECIVKVTNCTFTGNSASGYGGGMNNCESTTTITQCTFCDNRAWRKRGGGIRNEACSSVVTNCILWGNTAPDYPQMSGTPTVTYSNVQGDWEGMGNIDIDPCCFNPGCWQDPCGTPDYYRDDIFVPGDYHLKSQAGRYDPTTQSWVYDDLTSPCIDAGNPTSPIGHEPFPNGGIANIGAYGGTCEAGKSYFGKPPCEIIVAGDINGDCRIDFADFAFIARRWLQESTP